MLKEQGFVRVGAVVPKLKVADTEFNCNEIIKQIEVASNNKIQIAVFPELCVTGYTCQDLFEQDTLLEEAEKALNKILDYTNNLDIICIIGMPIKAENQLFNTAVVIQKGKILGIVPKTFIPNYGEFYEKRWFASSKNANKKEIEILDQKVPFGIDLLFKDKENNEICFGIEICEDIWAVEPPSNKLALLGANIIFNLSASNEVIGKKEYRRELVKMQSAKTISGYVYCSSGVNESTSDVVFSGESMIFENGSCLTNNQRFDFESNMIFTEIDTKRLANDRRKNISFMGNPVDLEYREIKINIPDNIENLTREYSKTPFVPEDKKKISEICEEILNIQSYGLAKRLLHTNINKTIIGISGGLDSALAFLVIIKAYEVLNLPKENIIAITMPGFGTTSRTHKNSIKLINEYGATFREINITKSSLQHFEDIGHDKKMKDITYENAQARERTKILMDIANEENGIVVGTGDLSELALGWCTYNGDHMSMYSVNASIPKTLVEYIIKWVADNSKEEYKNIINDILDTPISPELLPPDENGNIEQKTEEQVGPYILHDFFLYHFLRYGAEPKKIYILACKTFKNDFKKEDIKHWLQVFIKRFFTQQFKRNCMPDGPKVGTVSLSPRGDLRMPSDASYNIWLNNF
ncbi:MAG TPA: NAD(+) synthase [Clostridiaceae bacterium]|jgi:NAD+ synthetase|nr:nAD+ synthetase [Clostridium sp. CAG:452]HJJ03190.1 NAD(+) synthase [Clostridiaceae bacterium]